MPTWWHVFMGIAVVGMLVATIAFPFDPFVWWRRVKRRAIVPTIECELRRSERGLSGAELMQATRIGSYRLYPALAAMECCGKIVSIWDDGPYPRRRRYRLAQA